MMIEYKCRRCGIIHTPIGGNRSVVMRSLIALITDTPYQPNIGIPPTLLQLHHCKDKGYGISDIIGARLDEYDSK